MTDFTIQQQDIHFSLVAASPISLQVAFTGPAGLQGPTGPSNYVLTVGSTSTSPSRSETYYFGSILSLPLQTTSALCRTYIPLTGSIHAVTLYAYVSGTLGTDEEVSCYIRLNDTEDTLLGVLTLDAVSNMLLVTLDTDVDVQAGDFFELKLVCPNWVTAPTNVYMVAQVYCV